MTNKKEDKKKKENLKFILLVIAVLIFVLLLKEVSASYTETFYVCQGGDGSSPKSGNCATAWNASSLNNSNNWNTAAATVDGKIGPGDRIFFMHDGGDITGTGSAVLTILQSGTATAHITLEGDGIAALSGENTREVLEGGGQDYIDIKNLTIKNAYGDCIAAYDANNWTIDHCEIGPSPVGPTTGAKTVVLSFCGNGWNVSNSYIYGSNTSHNVYVYSKTGAYGSSDIVFEHNHFANSSIDNLKFNGVDVYFTGIVVRYNLFENGGYSDLDLSTTDGAEVYGNIFMHNITGRWEGIYVGDDSTGAAHVKNTKIWNNLFYGYFEGMIYMAGYHNVSTPSIAELYNNIFYSLGGACASGPACTDQYYIDYIVPEANISASDYNLFYTNASAKWQLANGTKPANLAAWEATMPGFDTNSLSTNPLLVNPPFNFSLQSTSPCIDAGKDVGIAEDYISTPIPRGAAPDIGPYEYNLSDTSYPQFSAYWSNNASLNDSGTGKFNVTLSNTNGTVWLEINGINVTAKNMTANIYNASYAFSYPGTYNYKWYSWGNGTNHNFNVSDTKSYTVNATGEIYYASPTGGGNGLSPLTPFSISSFWTVGGAGDTLYLLNGTYNNTNSMINPPDFFGGQFGNPVTIKAFNEGGVLIDGGFIRYTVYLVNNNYTTIEGINVNGSYGSDIYIASNSTGDVIRRVVAWDASPYSDNNQIYLIGGAQNTLLEDVAGWGDGRKIFGLYYDINTTIRRCFFRWTFHNSTVAYYKIGLTNGYHSINTTVENCIGTWDELPGVYQVETNAIFGIDQDPPGPSTTKLLGSIGYQLSTQTGSPSGIIGEWWGNTTNFIMKDVIAYTDKTDPINNFQLEDTTNFTASHLTSIGGVGGTWRQASLWSGYPNQNVQDSIVMGSLGNGTNTGSYFDYMMYWNNTNNYQGSSPSHYAIQDPQLVANGGNILQYGLSEAQRPKVNGTSVGAQIQYRYVNGVLTNQSLWPWPMNDRIEAAMITSGYDHLGGIDGSNGTDVTKTVFELGGGTEPNWNALCEPNTYYIDFANGSDSNNGTCTNSAWQHAPGDPNATGNPNSTSLSPGDTVKFKGGVVYYGVIHVYWSGTSGNPITYTNYSDSAAIIDGTGTDLNDTHGLFDWPSSYNWITLENMEIRNYSDYGVWVNGNYNTIQNCNIHTGNSGSEALLLRLGNYSKLINNTIHDAGWNCLDVYNAEHTEIAYNDIYDCPLHGGINVMSDTGTYYGIMPGNNIHHNYIHGDVHGAIYTRYQQNNTIYDNIIDLPNATNPNIYISKGGTGGPSSYTANTEIYNNLLIGGSWSFFDDAADNVTLKNNIMMNPASNVFISFYSWITNHTIDYNLYNGTGVWRLDGNEYSTLSSLPSPYEDNGLMGNPGFVNESGNDFRYMNNSDAIDRGTDLSSIFTIDYAGTHRPQGSGWDIGAYEYVSNSSSNVTTTSNSPANGYSTNNATIIFNCSATSNANLINMTLYGNWTGSWSANQTINISGMSNSTTFTKNLTDGNYIWNCLAYDNNSNSAWGSSNYTLTADTIVPSINFTNPTPANATRTSNSAIPINISISELNLNSIIYNWNGTNFTVFNNSLVLMMNFQNLSALGENSTYVVDNSPYGNNGIISGATLNISCGTSFGNCMQFNGLTNGINVTNSSNINNLPQYTVSVWANVYDSGGGGQSRFFDKTNKLFEIANISTLNSTLFVSIIYGTASLKVASANGTIIYGSWHNYAMTWNGNNTTDSVHLYRDGIEITGRALLQNGSGVLSSDSPYGLNIGNVAAGTRGINGSIDEFQIWNRTLSPAEINQNYMNYLLKINSTQWYLQVNQTNDSTTGLSNGNYTYKAYAIDVVGNINSTNTRSIQIISPNLTATLISPANGLLTPNTTITFNCSSVENGNSTLTNVTLYGNWTGSWSANETKNISGMSNSTIFIKNLSDGNYIWNCKAYDNNGSYAWAASNYSLMIDITPPVVTLVSPANASTWTSSSTVTFTYNVTDANSIANCSLIINNALDKTGSSITKSINQTLTESMANGVYNWSVNCTDAAGNQGNSSTYSLTVSYTAPTAPSGGGGGGGGGSSSVSNQTNVNQTSQTNGTQVNNNTGSQSTPENTATNNKVNIIAKIKEIFNEIKNFWNESNGVLKYYLLGLGIGVFVFVSFLVIKRIAKGRKPNMKKIWREERRRRVQEIARRMRK